MLVFHWEPGFDGLADNEETVCNPLEWTADLSPDPEVATPVPCLVRGWNSSGIRPAWTTVNESYLLKDLGLLSMIPHWRTPCVGGGDIGLWLN